MAGYLDLAVCLFTDGCPVDFVPEVPAVPVFYTSLDDVERPFQPFPAYLEPIFLTVFSGWDTVYGFNTELKDIGVFHFNMRDHGLD